MLLLLVIVALALCVIEFVQTKSLWAGLAAIVLLVAAVLALGVVKI